MKIHPIYGALCAAALCFAIIAPASGTVIISQYYEGTSFNKYIELYNSGATDIDLEAGEYKLSHWSNANREGWKTDLAPTGTLSLTGTIPAGGTFLIAHAQAAEPAYALPPDLPTPGDGVNFNGDDSAVVWTGATYSFANVVDAFGVTGSGFDDLSYVRNADITSGTNADFDPSQWTQFSLADVSDAVAGTNQRLGDHAIIPEPSTLALVFVSLGGLLLRRK